MAMMYTNTLSYDMAGSKRRKSKAKGEVYRKFTKPKFEPMTTTSTPYRRDEGVHYPSVQDTIASGVAARREPQKYTGTLVKGIATMHKSNAVPVIDDQQAKDLASMRR